LAVAIARSTVRLSDWLKAGMQLILLAHVGMQLNHIKFADQLILQVGAGSLYQLV